MTRRYFGTDGVRATVGTFPMTPDFVMLLGQASGRVIRRENAGRKTTVLIGKDTRVSGYLPLKPKSTKAFTVRQATISAKPEGSMMRPAATLNFVKARSPRGSILRG